MFGKFRREEPSVYDDAIAAILERMVAFDPIDAEYEDMVEHVERLTKLKGEGRKKVSADTVAIVLGNLAGILVIVMYEQKHVMTSKATQFILKAK